MKLILHIGTHKTASTSIQHFCALNRKLLREYGVHYPRYKESAYVGNFLGSSLAHQHFEDVSRFMEKAYIDARKKRCDTVLISAESFYAMAGFFLLMSDKPFIKEGYFETEDFLIGKFREYCARFQDVQVLCYLRPQDDFASSLYNQAVKNTYGTSEDFETYIGRCITIFDYHSHIQLWQKHFGQNNVELKKFDLVKENIIESFSSDVISPSCFAKAQRVQLHSNERLCRDVLEFKREHNKIPKTRPEAFITVRCFHQLARFCEDGPGYQTFAPYDNRLALFRPFQVGNEKLFEDGLETIVNKTPPGYPGLSPQKQQEISLELERLKRTPKHIFEFYCRVFINFVARKVPASHKTIDVLRTVRNDLRLKLEGW